MHGMARESRDDGVPGDCISVWHRIEQLKCVSNYSAFAVHAYERVTEEEVRDERRGDGESVKRSSSPEICSGGACLGSAGEQRRREKEALSCPGFLVEDGYCFSMKAIGGQPSDQSAQKERVEMKMAMLVIMIVIKIMDDLLRCVGVPAARV